MSTIYSIQRAIKFGISSVRASMINFESYCLRLCPYAILFAEIVILRSVVKMKGTFFYFAADRRKTAWKAFRAFLAGVAVDAYLAFLFMFMWPLSTMFAYAASDFTPMLLPMALTLHVVYKREAVIRRSICVKRLAYAIVRQAESAQNVKR